MKNNKKTLNQAKKILKISSPNGEVNENRLRKLLEIIKTNHPSQYPQILKAIYDLLVKRQTAKDLIVESAHLLSEEEKRQLLSIFEKASGKKLTLKNRENKELIGGLRVTLEDTVWENSVSSNLERLVV